MQAVIAYGDDLDIIPDVWVRGTVLSRSGLELRWESQELPYKLRDFLRRRLAGIIGEAVVENALKVPIDRNLGGDRMVWGPEFLVNPRALRKQKCSKIAGFSNTNFSPLQHKQIWGDSQFHPLSV